MKRVTVKYSINEVSREFPDGTTVGQILSDGNIRAILGYGDNVKVTLNGVELPREAIAPGDSTLFIETRANQKAS